MKKIQIIALCSVVLVAVFLRFYNLSINPPGLNWDETAFGYDAYSILKTGHDHHARTIPLFFESFGDWKLPVYFYLLVPSVAIFKLTEFAIRFPSAFFAVLTIPLLFLFIRKLTQNVTLALLSAFFLAISPWHIQFSRGGFETVPGLFFLVLGTFLFTQAVSGKKSTLFLLSGFSFVTSMYSYHAYRIFVPLFALTLTLLYAKDLKKMIPKLLIPAIFIAIFLFPLAKFTLSPEGKMRATTQTVFKKENFDKAKLDFDQKSKKPFRFMSKYLYQKPIYYSYVAANAYLDHFSPIFLFFKGDQIGRHSQVDMGQIYLFELLLLAVGMFNFKRGKENKIMLFWLLLGPIPAIIVEPTPHANRALQMVVPLAYFSALGAYHIVKLKNFLIPKIIFTVFSLYYFFLYTHLLFVHYPKKFSADWQDGYKQMVEKVEKYQDGYGAIYVTNINQVPYIYLLFYLNYNPESFVNLGGTRDHFSKYFFVSPEVDIYNKGRILYVAPSWQKVDGKWVDAVDDSTGKHIYSLWEVGSQK